MFLEDWILSRMMLLVPLWLSLTVHEWAHAWSASVLGDDTAERMGRMTLNPLAHIDPVGTLLLPLIGVPFGWAKPVPINPVRFRRGVSMRGGIMLTAAAGPISNIVIAMISMLLLILVARFQPLSPAQADALTSLLSILVMLNVLLALFNMLPIPPLDGSRVADALMPEQLRPLWDSFAQIGPVALLLVIVLPLFLGFGGVLVSLRELIESLGR